MQRNIKILFSAVGLFSLLLFAGCEIDPVNDPNNPSLGSVSENASKPELQVLVTGLEARHRAYFTNATQMFGSFGREVWAYFGSDPRFISHWLGNGVSATYPDFFGSGGTYVTPYLAVKQANVLISSAQNSTNLTGQEAEAYIGLGKTLQAYQLIWPLMQQWDNGIRVDVEVPLNPGPTLSRTEALAAIRTILNEGNDALSKAGSTLPYDLTSGFFGFDSPEGLKKINRAIAARVALYAGDGQGALDALTGSFMDMEVDAASSAKMLIGPAHVYGDAPDINNPLFYPYDRPTNTILIAHPGLIEDALPNDQRVTNKFIKRVENPASNPGLVDANGERLLGEYQDNRWPSNTSPIPWIRNEELILIYAEAQLLQSNPTEAVKAIDIVRNTWGVGSYGGGTSTDELMDEILFQRRYSLWSEGGHRWIDLRRTDRLNDKYIDLRDLGTIFTQVDRRTSEINWDEG